MDEGNEYQELVIKDMKFVCDFNDTIENCLNRLHHDLEVYYQRCVGVDDIIPFCEEIERIYFNEEVISNISLLLNNDLLTALLRLYTSIYIKASQEDGWVSWPAFNEKSFVNDVIRHKEIMISEKEGIYIRKTEEPQLKKNNDNEDDFVYQGDELVEVVVEDITFRYNPHSKIDEAIMSIYNTLKNKLKRDPIGTEITSYAEEIECEFISEERLSRITREVGFNLLTSLSRIFISIEMYLLYKDGGNNFDTIEEDSIITLIFLTRDSIDKKRLG